MTPLPREPGILLAIVVFHLLLLGAALAWTLRQPSALACAGAALATWQAGVALNALARGGLGGRAAALYRRFAEAAWILAAAAGAGWHLVHAWQSPAIFDGNARAAGLSLAALAIPSWFFSSLARAAGRRDLAPPGHQLAALAAVLLAAGLALLLRATSVIDLVRWTCAAAAALPALLVVEGLLGVVVAFYQPRSLREAAPALGGSILLGWCFQRENPWTAATHALEQTFGLKVGGTPLFGFLQRTLEPALAGGLLLLWLSTALTIVGPGHAGIRIEQGKFQPAPLAPGLHLHAPWPFARVEIVPAQRVREVVLGFDQDLSGAILWAENHYAGEKNLLVGDGGELLTISAPIHYRIKDPVAFHQSVRDGDEAVQNLAYRELLRITSTRTSFGLMTTDRAEISSLLQHDLQAAFDRHNLGIEILWVGLKDIHPPVQVAPAFQDVISADEERAAIIDREKAARATALQEARSAATRLRSDADALAHERTAVAEGEAGRFLSTLAGREAHPELFRLRRQLDATEAGLREARSLLLVPGGSERAEYYLDVKSPVPLIPTLVR